MGKADLGEHQSLFKPGIATLEGELQLGTAQRGKILHIVSNHARQTAIAGKFRRAEISWRRGFGKDVIDCCAKCQQQPT